MVPAAHRSPAAFRRTAVCQPPDRRFAPLARNGVRTLSKPAGAAWTALLVSSAVGADGVPLDGVAFHPYHTSKDLVAIIVFLMIFCFVVFFAPDMGGYFLEHANFEPANLTATPEHIAPVWYFTPFYAILRAVPDKLWGFILFGVSVLLPLFLPWLDRSRVRSIRYRGWIYKSALSIFVVTFLTLGWLGTMPAEPAYVLAARIFAVIYFAFFLLMPYYTTIDKTKPVPERVVYHG